MVFVAVAVVLMLNKKSWLQPPPLLAGSPSGINAAVVDLSHGASRRLLIHFRYNNKEQMPVHREGREMF